MSSYVVTVILFCFVVVVIAFPFNNDFLWNYFCLIIVKKIIELVDMIFMLGGNILKIL